MTFRKIVSISIAFSFIVLFVTGVLSYLQAYARITATLHTVFGILFSVGVFCHIANNIKPLKRYGSEKKTIAVFSVVSFLFLGAYFQAAPFQKLMDYGAAQKATTEKTLNQTTYEIIEMNTHKAIQLTLDVLRSKHYWHPQMAVWTEDVEGNYLETIFVTKATAKGLFFGGRSKDNFKTFDAEQSASSDYRRVNALPVWSHKRNVPYADSMFVPTPDHPLPDGISGATIVDNFKLQSSIDTVRKFKLHVELNVAFDDNEFYSEFDFPDDEIFHSGTGQLGQPSIVFSTTIDMNDNKDYYLMDLIGHGHQSGQNGKIYTDLSTLTTAKEIVERIVVGVKRIEKDR